MRKLLLLLVLVLVAVPAGFALVTGGAEASKEAPAGCEVQQRSTAKLVCTTTTERLETRDVAMVSGCVAGPTGVPGRRTRTFRNTYLVTEVTTTSYKNANQKKVMSSTTEETGRQLLTSQEISSVCEPISST